MKVRIACDNSLKDKVFSLQGNNIFLIDSYSSYEDLLDKINSMKKYDIIFINNDLAGNGIKIGQIIKNLNPDTILIYVSNHKDFNIIQAEPFAYIQQPINISDLDNKLTNALRRIHYYRTKYCYYVNKNGTKNQIDLNRVMYFESKHRIVVVHSDNNAISFYHKLDTVETEIFQIYPFFIRISKSFLVNMRYVFKIMADDIILRDNTILHISPQYKSSIQDFLYNNL